MQWLRLCAPNAGAWVPTLVREVDPTCCDQGPLCHNQDPAQPNIQKTKQASKKQLGQPAWDSIQNTDYYEARVTLILDSLARAWSQVLYEEEVFLWYSLAVLIIYLRRSAQMFPLSKLDCNSGSELGWVAIPPKEGWSVGTTQQADFQAWIWHSAQGLQVSYFTSVDVYHQ